MSTESPSAEQSEPSSLRLRFGVNLSSTICDISGKVPLAIDFNVWRADYADQEGVRRTPVDVVTNGTFLDVSSALSTGLLSLVERDLSYPDQEWTEGIRKELPTEVFANAILGAPSTTTKVVRLKNSPEANKTDPQRVRSVLDPAITALLKAGNIYSLVFPPEAHAYQRQGPWSGGITRWKPSFDSALMCEVSASSWESKATAKKALKGPMVFKAMSDFPRPPRIDYCVEFSPEALSLSSPTSMKIVTRIRLLEATNFTVMWLTPHGRTPLGSEKVGSFCFDLFDPETGEVLSGTPGQGSTTQWNPYLPRTSKIRREQLRELVPEEVYVAESDLIGKEIHGLGTVARYFRIKNIDTLVNRRLGVKLRPVDTYWSMKGIDELFAETDIVQPDQWYMPLTIESSATANFTLVP